MARLSLGQTGTTGLGGAHLRPSQTRPVSQQPPPGLTCLGSQMGGLAQAAAGSLAVAEAVYWAPWSLCSTCAEMAALTVLVMVQLLRAASALETWMTMVIEVDWPTLRSL